MVATELRDDWGLCVSRLAKRFTCLAVTEHDRPAGVPSWRKSGRDAAGASAVSPPRQTQDRPRAASISVTPSALSHSAGPFITPMVQKNVANLPVVLGIFAVVGIGTLFGPLVGAAVFLLAFVLYERRHRNPVLDVTLFRSRGFAMGSFAICAGFFCLLGFVFITIMYFQAVLGYGPLETAVRDADELRRIVRERLVADRSRQTVFLRGLVKRPVLVG